MKREIEEELGTEITVEDLLTVVDYDYPKFHLSMQCFLCSIDSAHLTLKEHQAFKWLTGDELDTVDWLPADTKVVEAYKQRNKKFYGQCYIAIMGNQHILDIAQH